MLEALRSWAPFLALLAVATIGLAAPLAFGSHVVVQGGTGRPESLWWWLLVALCAGTVGLGALALVLLLL
jgi:hypothetical protein